MRILCRANPIASRIQAISAGVLLFCFFLALYSLFTYGSIRYGDEAERYYQARSLVDSHSLVIPLIPGEGITGVGNQPYSQFEMGYGLVLIPFYALGKAVSAVLPFPDNNWVPVLVVGLSNPVVTSLTCLALYWLSRTLGATTRASVLGAVVYGLGTIALAYSRGLYREPMQGLTLIGAVCAIIKFRQTGQSRWMWISGTCFGYLALTKVANMFMLPLFPLYLLFVSSETNRVRRFVNVARQCAIFLIPVIVLLTFQGLVNVVKFGNLFNIGPFNYGNPIPYFSVSRLAEGVGGLLFSSSKSLFLFSPPVILFAPAWVVLFRKYRAESLLIMALVVGNVIFSGLYIAWDGGSYWGPRYLVLIVPLMILPLGFVLSATTGLWRRVWGGLFAAGFLAGLGVQVLGALTNDREYLDVMGRTIDLAGALDLARHGAIESLAFSLSPTHGLQVNQFGWMMIGIATLLFLGLVARAWTREGESGHVVLDILAGAGLTTLVIGVFMFGVGAPYRAVRTAKADTKYVAANSFFREEHFCEAQSFYSTALYLGTTFEQASMARLEEIAPAGQGPVVDLGDLTAQVMGDPPAQVERDYAQALTEEGAIRIQTPTGTPSNVETDSDFVDVLPNTAYELSGWYRSEAVSGSGYGIVSWYEDNAKWQQQHVLDIAAFGGTQGWQPFRKTIKTLPTSRRALLKTGLWQASGTIWVDGIRLVELENGTPPSRCIR